MRGPNEEMVAIVERACVRVDHAVAREAVAALRTAEGRHVARVLCAWMRARHGSGSEARFELLVIAVWEALPSAHRAYAREAAHALCNAADIAFSPSK